MIKKLINSSNNMKLFVTALYVTAIVSTALIAIFGNYLDDVYHLNSQQRGFLEFPRELPGLYATLIIALLFFIGDIKIAAFSVLLTAIGFMGLGLIKPNFYYMLFFTMLWSTGEHVYMSMRDVLAINISSNQNKGYILGVTNSIRSLGVISGTLIIWLLMGKFNFSYNKIFIIFSVLSFIGFILLLNMKVKNPIKRSRKVTFIFRKKYSLFYILAALFGIRKQLFLVFAPWLLIKFFNQKAQDIAVIYFISAVFGLFLRPYLGRAIDKYGEKRVLFFDAILVFFLSIAYIFAPLLSSKIFALGILYFCFIVDDILFFLRTARTTYLYKILKYKEDLAPTLAMGLSIEHIVSMTAPMFAGFLWINYGYYWAFLLASFVAILSLFASLKIKTA